MNTPRPAPSSNEMAAERTDLAGLRSHLANERTHLAYLRTTVSLIGFGITLNRFSIYLQQNDRLTTHHTGLLRDTGNVGLGMVVIGLGLLVWSLYRFWAVSKDIEQNRFVPHYKTTMVISLGLLLAGGLSAVWLFMY